jgi:DNA-binding SARP family transcriptional activator
LHLRKVLGWDAIATRGAGCALRVEPEALDLDRFERLAEDGSLALNDGHFDQAAATRRDL